MASAAGTHRLASSLKTTARQPMTYTTPTRLATAARLSGLGEVAPEEVLTATAMRSFLPLLLRDRGPATTSHFRHASRPRPSTSLVKRGPGPPSRRSPVRSRTSCPGCRSLLHFPGAGAERLERSTAGFGDQCSTN